MAGILRRMDEWWAPGTREQLRSVHQELQGIHRAVGRKGGQVGEEGLAQIRNIVVSARKQVQKVLEGNDDASVLSADSPHRGGLV